MDYTPTTALIVVDVQNDFADPSGSLYVAGGETTIPFINEQIAAANEMGATVVYTTIGIPNRRLTSPRTAASGRCTASVTLWAPSSIPISS